MTAPEKHDKTPATASTISQTDKLSIAAFIVSAISLTTSIWGACYQQKQWRLSSPATVDLAEANFVQWRTLTGEEVRRLPSDQPIELIQQVKGTEATGVWGVPSELMAIHRQTGQVVAGVSAITLQELELQLKALSLASSDVEIRRHSRVAIELKNSGPTSARNVRWIVTLTPSDAAKPIVSSGSTSSIPPSGSRFGQFDGYGPANATIPETYCFSVDIRYDTLDQKDLGQTQTFCYDKRSGGFRSGKQ